MVVSRVDLEDFVKDYEEQSDREKENFSRVSNKLLAKTFIVAELRDDKEDYYKSLELFKMLETYFSFIDYEVVKDEINKIIYIKTTKDHNRFHLNKFETILSLIETCYEHDWYIRWYIGDVIYVKYKDARMFPAYKTTKGLNIVEVGNDYKNYINNVTQLVICDINGKIQQIYDYVAEVFKDKLGLQQNTGFTMDVTPPGITKAVGLKKLADYLGVKQEEVMAIGDGDNDLSMIKYAGCGVAMENAIADLKAEASFITKDCDEDGVAYAIEKFVL